MITPPVRVLQYVPQLTPAASAPTVAVTLVNRHIDRAGRQLRPKRVQRIDVPVDSAGDLATESLAWVIPAAGDDHGDSEWAVAGLGFTEHEALAACDTAIEAWRRR